MIINTPYPRPEAGNVLWFIMVGVALLAALTMTLSRSASNIENSGDEEKLNIEALYIMRHAQGLETAIQNLKFQGISENDISFENNQSTTDYTNPNCTNNSCKLFHIQGAGLTYLPPKTSWLDNQHIAEDNYGEWIFTANSCVPKIGTGNDATCASDESQLELIAILPYIRQNLCQQINTLNAMTITNDNPPQDIGDSWGNSPAFTGTFSNAENIADNNEDLFNHATGCFEGAGTPPSASYHFYQVLLAR